jgi:hypothetical protein
VRNNSGEFGMKSCAECLLEVGAVPVWRHPGPHFRKMLFQHVTHLNRVRQVTLFREKGSKSIQYPVAAKGLVQRGDIHGGIVTKVSQYAQGPRNSTNG